MAWSLTITITSKAEDGPRFPKWTRNFDSFTENPFLQMWVARQMDILMGGWLGEWVDGGSIDPRTHSDFTNTSII